MIGGLRGIIAEGEVLTKQCYLSREWDVWFHKLKELEKEIQDRWIGIPLCEKAEGMRIAALEILGPEVKK